MAEKKKPYREAGALLRYFVCTLACPESTNNEIADLLDFNYSTFNTWLTGAEPCGSKGREAIKQVLDQNLRDPTSKDILAAYQYLRAIGDHRLGKKDYPSGEPHPLAIDFLEQAAPKKPKPKSTYVNNLPRRNGDWTGRVDEVDQLCAALQSGQSAAVYSLAGMGGVGKTELAMEAAHRLPDDQYPDGKLVIDLQGFEHKPLLASAAMTALLLQIDSEQRLPEQLGDYYQGYLRGRQMLLILDNARNEDHIAALIPPDPVSLIITSRNEIRLTGGRLINLDRMKPKEAFDLLGKELDATKAAMIDLAELARLCDFLPLVLSATAGAINASWTKTPAQIMSQMADNVGSVRGMEAVQLRLAASLDVLAEDDAALYARYLTLSIMPASFTVAAGAAVMGVEMDAAEDVIDQLCTRSLLIQSAEAAESTDARFRLHDLLREAAGSRLEEDARFAANLRHVTWCRDVLWCCRRLEDHGGEQLMAALRLFDTERSHVEAGQGWLAEHWDEDDQACEIAADYPTIAAYVAYLRLQSGTRIVWFEMQAAAAKKRGDKQSEGNALGNLGVAYAGLDEPQRAIEYYEQHYNIACEIGDRRGEGIALGNLGIAHMNLGEPRRAIEYHDQALVISREIGDRLGEGQDLGNLGIAYADLGEHRRAIGYYEQDLVIAREIGDRRGEGIALWNSALAHEELDEQDLAIECAKKSWVIYRDIEDPFGPNVAKWLREYGIDPDSL